MLDFQKAISAIEHSNNILILPSSPVDGDSLGSSLALYDVLKAQGKSATVVLTSEIPDIYKFLPSISHIHTSAEMYSDFMITLHLKDQELENIRHEIVDDHVNIIVTPTAGRFSSDQVSFPEPKKHYDLIITVDCADLTQLGEFYRQHFQIFSEVPSINIDHHISNKNYASLNLVDAGYCSTTHILYDLLLEMSAEINEDVATLLLAGIITDTGSFQNTNTTPEAFDVAAELIELGGRQQEIIQHIYKTKQLNSLKLWGKILSKIQVDSEYNLMWTTLTQIDLKETDTTNQDKGEIMDELLSNAEDANIVLLLEERDGGVLHGSIRVNTDDIDAVEIAENFGGGGHQRAAGFNITGATVESHESKILKFIRQYLDGGESTMQNTADSENSQTQEDMPLQPVAVPVPEGFDQSQLNQDLANTESPQVSQPLESQISSDLESQDDVSEDGFDDMPQMDGLEDDFDDMSQMDELEDDFDDMPPLPLEQPMDQEEFETDYNQEEFDSEDQEEFEPLDFSGVQTKVAKDFDVEPPKQDNQTQISELDSDFDNPTPVNSAPINPQPVTEAPEQVVSTPTEPIGPMEPMEPMGQIGAVPNQPATIQPVEMAQNMSQEASEETLTEDLPLDDSINTNDQSIESELISEASEEAQDQNLDAELAPILTEQTNDSEERIKDLSQKFFTEQAAPATSTPEQVAPQATTENPASQPGFSEIPSFGENLDLSQVAATEPTQDEMEFPPNPFAEQNDPGSLPNPDVPEDL